MNEKVISVLKEQLWFVGTFSDVPNVVPIGFKDILPDGRLLIGDVFLQKTLENIRANGQIVVSACDPATHEGYQVKGRAEYLTDGPIVEDIKKKAAELFKGKLTPKGALVITPEKTFVTTPGPDNNKEI